MIGSFFIQEPRKGGFFISRRGLLTSWNEIQVGCYVPTPSSLSRLTSRSPTHAAASGTFQALCSLSLGTDTPTAGTPAELL